MDVLIAGGGTGGHLFPGIALAQELRKRNPDSRILFVGSPRGIEKHAVPKAGFDLSLLPIAGLRGTRAMGFLKGLWLLVVSMFKAFSVVKKFKPQVAVSCGGYAAGPAVLASKILGIPCVVLEQNAIPGWTNRFLGKMAQLIIASLPVEGFPPAKVRVLGNPVRRDLLAVRDKLYAPGDEINMLVFGGSQGARALNEVMLELIPKLQEKGVALNIVHQTGPHDFERISSRYKELNYSSLTVVPFLDDMASAYDRADLVLCRAGATKLAELTVCGRPAILVPFPFAVDDHQTKNAKTLADKNAAILLPQPELSADRLLELLATFLNNRKSLIDMANQSRDMGTPNAVIDIADVLENEVLSV